MSVTTSRLRCQAHLFAGVSLFILWLIIYLFTVSPTVNFIDSGELITAAYEPGIAHPPGYPLYVLTGYVVTHLLWGDIAWRMNVLSAFWAAMCVGALYFLILSLWSYIRAQRAVSDAAPTRRMRGSKAISQPGTVVPAQPSGFTAWEILAAAGAASLMGASASFWSRSAQAKMYSLHFFFISLLYLLALGYRRAYERGDIPIARRWLVGLVVAGAFSFTNHLMTSLLVPGLVLMVLYGDGWRKRLRGLVREWRVIIPSLLPLLLYAYLPLRMAGSPYMNWGSPDNWGDFRRHITGWQYTAYWFRDVEGNLALIRGYIPQQWGLLTLPIMAVAMASGVYFFRLNRQLFLATAATAALTIFFSIGYTISEIEPYLVPIYMMLTIWVGVASVALASNVRTLITPGRKNTDATAAMSPPYLAALLLVAAALVGILIQYPQQDRSRDRMAPLFVRNAFSELPRDSILITDYWDFYAPTYYLQRVMGERPDITVIDISLLTYPWYTNQLRKYAPQVMARSEDIIRQFSIVQRKWVEGQAQASDISQLNNLYPQLLTSFVERNPERRAYVLFNAPCNEPQAPQGCAGNQVAPAYMRFPAGLALELVKAESRPPPPPMPRYDLRGITSEQVRLDDAACGVASYYAATYQRLSRLYQLATMPDQATQSAQKAADISAVLQASDTCRSLSAGRP